MAFNPFRKIRVPPEEELTAKHINTVQDNLSIALGQLLGKDILDLKLLKNVKLIEGTNYISHGLGRILNGWYVVRAHDSNPILFDMQDTNDSPQLILVLSSELTTTVDLIVF